MNPRKFIVTVERSKNGGPFEPVETSAWTLGEEPAFTPAVPIEAVDGFKEAQISATDESGVHTANVGEWTYRFTHKLAH